MTTYRDGLLVPIPKVVVIFTIPKRFERIHYNSKKKVDFHLQRIFTDADLYNLACFNKITEAVRIIEDLITEKGFEMPEETDLVLDLDEDDGEEVVDYYFADHEKRIIVFVHKFDSDYLPHWHEIKGVSSGTHLRMSSLPSY